MSMICDFIVLIRKEVSGSGICSVGGTVCVQMEGGKFERQLILNHSRGSVNPRKDNLCNLLCHLRRMYPDPVHSI